MPVELQEVDVSDERVFLLDGILSCGECGRPMRPRPGAGLDAYGCSPDPEALGETCSEGLKSADRVEASVLEMLRLGALSRRRATEREPCTGTATETETRALGLALAAARANHRRLEAAIEADGPGDALERHGRKELLRRLAREIRLLEDCLQLRAPLGGCPWLEVALLRRFCEVFEQLEAAQRRYALRLLLRRAEVSLDACELELKTDLRPLAWFLNRNASSTAERSTGESGAGVPKPLRGSGSAAEEREDRWPWSGILSFRPGA